MDHLVYNINYYFLPNNPQKQLSINAKTNNFFNEPQATTPQLAKHHCGRNSSAL